ncbi:hypothetical protein [Microbacterium sp. YY-01]|uniref:hypothetical protein n=1 Tax=Microbacterium sp. YY-01 TaxID=3421634 RepID=UPI003D163C08
MTIKTTNETLPVVRRVDTEFLSSNFGHRRYRATTCARDDQYEHSTVIERSDIYYSDGAEYEMKVPLVDLRKFAAMLTMHADELGLPADET